MKAPGYSQLLKRYNCVIRQLELGIFFALTDEPVLQYE